MNRRTYLPLTPKAQLKNHTKSLVLSTGILAGIIAAGGYTQAVNAEELNLDQEELQALYAQYNEIEKAEAAETESESPSTEAAAELTEEQKEELAFIKTQLITMIELAGGQSVLDQLHNQPLSYEQLDTIFTALLENNVSATVTTDEATGSGIEELLTDEASETESEEISVEEDATEESEEAGEVVEEEQTEEEVTEAARPSVHSASENTVVEDEEQPAEEVEEKADDTSTEKPVEVVEKDTVKAEEPVVYVVKSGDTLGKIAQMYQTTVNKLASLNNITNVNRLSVGQVLAINEAGKEEAKAPQPTKPEGLEKVATPSEFIENLAGYAQNIASQNNLYASVMIAQASLESGYGKSSLSAPPNHNLFGIKGSYNGATVAKVTQEYYSSTGWITITDNFKKYPSYEESLQDNANLLRNGLRSSPAFYSGTWAENTTSYRDATLWLQGRYATDPTYASKLNRIIEQFNLTRFDIVQTKGEGTGSTHPAIPEKPATPPANPYEKVSVYKIVSGDTLSKIAQAFKTTVQDLKIANSLTSDLIFVNQELIVPVLASTPKPEPKPEPIPEPKPETPVTPVAPETPAAPEDDPEESTDSNETGEYTVVRGDTLSHIAKRFNLSVASLKVLNNLTGDVIYVDQKLIVSAEENPVEETEQTTPENKEEVAPGVNSIIVVRGDTLSQLAQKHNTTVAAIRSLNKMISDRIYVGQQLKLPQTAVSPVEEVKVPETVTPSIGNDQSSYTVKAGDTLSHIAKAHNMTVAQLRELNKLTSDLIRVNQTLTVSGSPVVETKPEPAKPVEKPVTATKPSAEKTVTVKAGDSLSAIARAHNVTLAQLKDWNTIADANRIYVGQKLTVVQSSPTQPKETVPSPATPVKTADAVYQVKSGDTLSGIARDFKVTISQLKEWNKLTSDIIFVNQKLTVKSGASKAETPAVPKPVSAVKAYTVKAGDTLSHIAKEFSVTVRELKDLNNLNSDLIFVNQRLTVSK